MTNSELFNLFKAVFPSAVISTPFEDLHINAIPEWDSLGNLNLLLRLEDEIGIRFSSKEISEVKSIKDIIVVLRSKGLYEI